MTDFLQVLPGTANLSVTQYRHGQPHCRSMGATPKADGVFGQPLSQFSRKLCVALQETVD